MFLPLLFLRLSQIERVKYLIKISFWLTLISLLLIFQRRYQNDFGLYHLPFIEMIKNYKLVVGSTNFNFRFGHTSIISYFTALFSFNINEFFRNVSLTISHIFILSYYIFFGLRIFFKKVNFNFFENIYIFSLVFIFLHIISLNKIGYDIFPLLFILISIHFITKKNISTKDILNNSLLIIYAIFLKTSVIFFAAIPLIIFFFNLKNFQFKKNINVILIIILLCFVTLITNFYKSSCLFYPITITCFDTTWLNKSYGASELIYLETSAWAKGWAYQNQLNYQEYLKDFNWLSNYLKNHFLEKVFFKAILPYLLLILIFIFSIKKNMKVNPVSQSSNNINLIFLVTGISLLSWMISSPDIRYGYAQLIIFFSIITTYISNKFYIKYKKIMNFIFIILIIQFFLRFTIYQYEVFSKKMFKDDYFPNTPKVEYLNKNGLNIPVDNLCWDVKFPCVTKESQINNMNINRVYNF